MTRDKCYIDKNLATLVEKTTMILALPASGGSAFSARRHPPYDLRVADQPDNLLSFREWQGHDERFAVRLEDDDRAALGQIIALLCRPQRPDLGLRYLQAYSNWRIVQTTGSPHPNFQSKPRKKRSEITANLATLDRFFHRGLRAGSVLEAAWAECRNPRDFGFQFSVHAPGVFNLAGQHGDRLAPHSDERKKLWSDYLPVAHLAMTMRRGLLAAAVDPDSGEWANGGLLVHLLNASISADWMSHFLVEAERWSYRLYHQQLIPSPERVVRLILRPRELAL